MRLLGMIAGDIRFQWKYGFYLLYMFFSVLYICLLAAFPAGWREKAAQIMIYSDPAAMGLFFMGAIVLLEKNERILNALAVSPVRKSWYILSKAVSLAVISALVALAISLVSGIGNVPMVVVGTALYSVMFTLIGIMAATKIQTMNQYFIVIIGIDVVCFTPPILGLFTDLPAVFRLYPFNAAMSVITGGGNLLPNLLVVLVAIVILYRITYRMVSGMWRSVGGVKL